MTRRSPSDVRSGSPAPPFCSTSTPPEREESVASPTTVAIQTATLPSGSSASACGWESSQRGTWRMERSSRSTTTLIDTGQFANNSSPSLGRRRTDSSSPPRLSSDTTRSLATATSPTASDRSEAKPRRMSAAWMTSSSMVRSVISLCQQGCRLTPDLRLYDLLQRSASVQRWSRRA